MPRGLMGRLIVAFALAVTCFIGATLTAHRMSQSIHRDAIGIASFGMPSIGALADAQEGVHAIIGELRPPGAAGEAPRSPRPGEVAAARQRIGRSLGPWQKLPESPTEAATRARVRQSLAELDRALAAMEGGPYTAERYEAVVLPPASRLFRALSGAIQYHVDRTQQVAEGIEAQWNISFQWALVFDALSAVFTLLVAYLVVRALREHNRIVEERNELMARRAEELELFAGRVAHDILGPLSAVTMALGRAAGRATDATTTRMIEGGQRSVARVRTIVDGLLRFARAGARPEPGVATEVRPVLESLVGELQAASDAAGVKLSLAPVPRAAVVGNPGVVSSLVENLLRNALKYMGDRRVRRVEVRVCERGEAVRFEVEDTGPGIAPALLGRVFDPHVRGPESGQAGIGLGLATVKRISESHGGRAGARSVPGVGSTFWFELPRAPLPGEAAEASPGYRAEPHHA